LIGSLLIGYGVSSFSAEEIDLKTFLNPAFENCIPRLIKPISKEVDFRSKWLDFRKHVELTELPVSICNISV